MHTRARTAIDGFLVRLLLCLATLGFCAAWPQARAGAVDPLAHVDPFIGTGGHGHTYPGATLPFGMVQLSPDTRVEGWDACSGYHDDDRRILGFSHTHLSGTGVPDYCDVLCFPSIGSIPWSESTGSAFRKETEVASPGYYAVTLDDSGIRAELTATLRAGMHRYTFPKTDRGFVLIDLTHRDEVIDSGITIVNDHEVAGFRESRSWAADQRLFFVAQTSKPFLPVVAIDGVPRTGLSSDLPGALGTEPGVVHKNVKAALRFATTQGEQVVIKVGISSVSIENARQNLETEMPGWDFDAVHDAARETWKAALSRIEIEGGTPEQQTIFYTALYHTLLQPNTFSDVNGEYRIADGRVLHADGYTRYTVFSLWDTFRAAHPLYTIIEPSRTVDFIKSMLGHYHETGRLPVWELWGNETDCMIGYHAASVITDAYVKGIRDFDAEDALAAMKATAERHTPGLDAYRTLGYIPSDVESESVSKTLEYAYDDWCIARMAETIVWPQGRSDSEPAWPRGSLDHLADKDEYVKRSTSWMNLFDPNTGFMRPKIEARFKSPFVPTDVDFNFTEANSWQYSFFVPHDALSLAEMLGGNNVLCARLDSLFTAPSQTTGRQQADITGLIGQYAHGNEPSHHIAYLYSVFDEPWKTQDRVRQIRESMYSPRPDGLAGNEDCGQMSAWYVLSALGFYSMLPGDSRYVITTPLFSKATIHQENGNSFVIRTEGRGPYIQSASSGDQKYGSSLLYHGFITAGRELRLQLGNSPGSSWGDGDRMPPVYSRGASNRPILATPFVASGASPFRDSTVVVLESPVPKRRITRPGRDPGVVDSLRALKGIHYTLDGTTPTLGSPRYVSPIRLRETTTVRFATIRDTLHESDDALLRARQSQKSPQPVWSSKVQQSTFRRISGNRRLVSGTEASPQYPGGTREALIDGVRGGPDFRLGAWQGFEGQDMEAVIDLGETTTLHRLSLGCLQDQNSWIFMPARVSFETSLDGVAFTPAGEATSGVGPHDDGGIVRDCEVGLTGVSARFVHVHAYSLGTCPSWHKGAGHPCWIFVDEVTAE